MNRLDRAMGILLLLRNGRVVSAAELSRRFEVSIRTVYRDMDVLSGLGIPVVPEMGRTGGFRLAEGYFLPPVALKPEEAVSLLLGLIFMKRLRVAPFPEEADFAERKLLAILPEDTRTMVERASRLIGFERVPPDLLHPERDDPLGTPAPRDAGAGARGQSAQADLELRRDGADRGQGSGEAAEERVVGRFLEAILTRSRVRLSYRSPYRPQAESHEVEPCGIIWDRDRWYLVGCAGGDAGSDAGGEGAPAAKGEPRMWRSDRVLAIGAAPSMRRPRGTRDIAELLDRRWLGKAMSRWIDEWPVRVAMTEAQAGLLRKDWYYGHARFEASSDGRVVMAWGESSRETVAALVRWLGPGAELLEPSEWREAIAGELEAMASAHRRGPVPVL